MKRILLLLLLLTGAAAPLRAQRFAVGTNAVDWLSLGTVNLEASTALSQRYSIHIGAELNPWTFHAGDPGKQLQMRQNSYWGGLRLWPWHVYSGWWAGGDARYTVYNLGGVASQRAEEGDAWGLGLWGGYSVMLSPQWNLDLGGGIWGGWKQYKVFACPRCGRVLEQGQKAFVLPDARIAFQLIF